MLPLEGLRVVDLTRVLSGPYCTMQLGDLGAEVIKIERPGAGDDTRAFAPPYQGDEAAYFLSVNRNKKREYMASRDKAKRESLKSIVMDRTLPVEDRFDASMKLAQLPRNGAKVRVRLRCEMSGRARANYRKFKLCRIALRDLASSGQIPGMTKSSW